MDSLSFSESIPAEKGFVHFFGTRQSPALLIDKVQVGQVTAVPPDYPCVISLKQVHGTEVVVLDGPVDEKAPALRDGDALVTNQPDVLLVVRTADCVPVLMVDMEQRVVAAVHAGWRGSVAGVVLEALSVMTQRFGSSRDQIRVAIGPSIGPCCFEVDEPVIRPVQEQFPFWSDVLAPISSTHAKLDLKALLRNQLEHAGLETSTISWSDDCTHCHSQRYYSYRREGKVNGTMLSGVMAKSNVCVS